MIGTGPNNMTNALLTPYTLGDLQLKNRIVMAPLTRTRAENPGRVPNELIAEYHAQRAGAGLIITEGTFVSEQEQGWYGAPESTAKKSAPGGSGLPMPFTAQAGQVTTERIAREEHFRTIGVHAFPSPGVLPSEALERTMPQLAAFEKAMPAGYQMEFGGEAREAG
jgi:N-ethylmaleimide reductase